MAGRAEQEAQVTKAVREMAVRVVRPAEVQPIPRVRLAAMAMAGMAVLAVRVQVQAEEPEAQATVQQEQLMAVVVPEVAIQREE